MYDKQPTVENGKLVPLDGPAAAAAAAAAAIIALGCSPLETAHL